MMGAPVLSEIQFQSPSDGSNDQSPLCPASNHIFFKVNHALKVISIVGIGIGDMTVAGADPGLF